MTRIERRSSSYVLGVETEHVVAVRVGEVREPGPFDPIVYLLVGRQVESSEREDRPYVKQLVSSSESRTEGMKK